MIQVFLIVAMLWLPACSSPSIDPSLQPYVDNFAAKAQANGLSVTSSAIQVSMKFGSTQEFGADIAGDCSSGNGFSGPSVVVDPTYWNASYEWYKQALVDHELGHCFLGRSHNENQDAAGCPTSLMNPNPFAATCIPPDETALYAELFGGAVNQDPLNSVQNLAACHELAMGVLGLGPIGSGCPPLGPPRRR
jgi:hypothetical protein